MESQGARFYHRLLGKIIKASKGQRDAMYFAARRMNMVKDFLVVPTLITSAIMGSALMTSRVSDIPWMKWACASIAFVNALLLTVHKITRPGELGELYQIYGRKWELFALNVLSMRKWQTQLKDDDKDINHDTSQLITRYNNMIEQSPLLPRWALSRFKASNEELSSDDEDDVYYISQGTDDVELISLPPPPVTLAQQPVHRRLSYYPKGQGNTTKSASQYQYDRMSKDKVEKNEKDPPQRIIMTKHNDQKKHSKNTSDDREKSHETSTFSSIQEQDQELEHDIKQEPTKDRIHDFEDSVIFKQVDITLHQSQGGEKGANNTLQGYDESRCNIVSKDKEEEPKE